MKENQRDYFTTDRQREKRVKYAWIDTVTYTRRWKRLTCGSPFRWRLSSCSRSTSTASTNSSEMAWSSASFVSTLCSISSSTISRFSLSIAIRSAERPNGSTQLMFISVSRALCNILKQHPTRSLTIARSRYKLFHLFFILPSVSLSLYFSFSFSLFFLTTKHTTRPLRSPRSNRLESTIVYDRSCSVSRKREPNENSTVGETFSCVGIGINRVRGRTTPRRIPRSVPGSRDDCLQDN